MLTALFCFPNKNAVNRRKILTCFVLMFALLVMSKKSFHGYIYRRLTDPQGISLNMKKEKKTLCNQGRSRIEKKRKKANFEHFQMKKRIFKKKTPFCLSFWKASNV